MATDAEVQAKRDRIDQLRAQRDEAKLAVQQVIRDAQNDVLMVQLDAEENMLLAEIQEIATTAPVDVPAEPGPVPDQQSVVTPVLQPVVTPDVPQPVVPAPDEQSGDETTEGK